MENLNVALVGASGAVGSEFLKLFEFKNFPIKNLKLLTSARSAGKSISFKGEKIILEKLTGDSFKNIDLAFFSAGAERSLDFAPKAVESGALVIDNSSAFRLDQKVPLIVPSCNIQEAKHNQGIIANPNCSTIQLVEALKPIHDFIGIQRVVVSTYQAVSGSGVMAIQELEQQIQDYAAGKVIRWHIYPYPIFMNAIPQVDKFLEGGYTKEEMKMVFETRKILNVPEMKITATCVRLPILRSHSESVLIETEKKLMPEKAIELWEQAGLTVKNKEEAGGYPTPREVAETFTTHIGRVREDLSSEKGLCFWCVADQLYKGAALNAIEIAEEYFFPKKAEPMFKEK